MKKNDQLEIVIDNLGNEGEGIGRVDGYALFVKGALPGERVLVSIMKMKKTYGFARLIEVLNPSPDRVTPPCPVYPRCGGCTLQHLSYAAQLAFKQQKVTDCLTRIGGVSLENVDVLPIIGMDASEKSDDLSAPHWHYRNKAQFPLAASSDGSSVFAGFFAPHSHNVIPVNDCAIQDSAMSDILKVVTETATRLNVEAYDEATHSGVLRHIFIRKAKATNEIMVCLVINARRLPHAEDFVTALADIPGMTSIYYNVQREQTNKIMGDTAKLLWGETYIRDYIGDISFDISPLSFYQVNPVQTAKLYESALNFANLTGNETVWDLYCGIGTISLFLARHAKRVIGVEIVPDAIEDAKLNAKENKITNTEFHCGAAETVVPALRSQSDYLSADVVVIDPPRKGCAQSLISTILNMAPEKIVYVSCDPATLARDVKLLMAGGLEGEDVKGKVAYEVKKVQAVDMFPGSGHVECVVALHRVDM